jgi:hypothetical protein
MKDTRPEINLTKHTCLEHVWHEAIVVAFRIKALEPKRIVGGTAR